MQLCGRETCRKVITGCAELVERVPVSEAKSNKLQIELDALWIYVYYGLST